MDQAEMDGKRLRMTQIVTKNGIAHPEWTMEDHFNALTDEGFSRYEVTALASRQVHAAIVANEEAGR